MTTENEIVEMMGEWIWKNICYSDFQYCGKAKDISKEYGRKLYGYMKYKKVSFSILKQDRTEEEEDAL